MLHFYKYNIAVKKKEMKGAGDYIDNIAVKKKEMKGAGDYIGMLDISDEKNSFIPEAAQNILNNNLCCKPVN